MRYSKQSNNACSNVTDSRAGDEMELWFDIEAVDSRHQSSGEIKSSVSLWPSIKGFTPDDEGEALRVVYHSLVLTFLTRIGHHSTSNGS
jgi:hypothetical protein